MRPYDGVCCTAAKCLPAIAIHCTGISPCCVCFVAFLHLNFSSTPNSILNMTILQEGHSFAKFNDTFCVGKYCQLFTHESIIDQYAISALYSPQTAPSLRRSPSKSNTRLPSPTPLITPNGIRIHSPMSPLLTSVDRQMARTNVLSQ